MTTSGRCFRKRTNLMNNASKQQLSALLDDELGADEARFLLRRVRTEPELAEAWSRYQLIGDSLRGCCVPVADGLCSRVLQQIEAEQAAPADEPHKVVRWLRLGVGGGIAAGVAAAALLWMQPMPRGPQTAPLAAEQVTAGATGQALAEVAAEPDVSAEDAIPAPQPDLNSLLQYGPYLNVQPAAAVRTFRSPMATGQPLPRQPVWLHRQATPQQRPDLLLRATGVERLPVVRLGASPPSRSAAQLPPH